MKDRRRASRESMAWPLAFGQPEDRTPTHWLRGDARGREGGVRQGRAGVKGVDRPAGGSIQNNCAFWRFRTHCQAHAFSSANPRKPAFPCIDPRDCKTIFGRRSRPARTSRDRLAAQDGHALDRYGHLFPSADDGTELAAAEKALLR